jgi:predicted nucleic acid-binding protein
VGAPRRRLPQGRDTALVKLTDALIAATAIERGLPIVTQDEDYAVIARAHPALRVIRV